MPCLDAFRRCSVRMEFVGYPNDLPIPRSRKGGRTGYARCQLVISRMRAGPQRPIASIMSGQQCVRR